MVGFQGGPSSWLGGGHLPAVCSHARTAYDMASLCIREGREGEISGVPSYKDTNLIPHI